MRTRARVLCLLAAGAASGLLIAACCQLKDNAAATSKCGASSSGEACEKCCKGEGVSGYAFATGKGCRCVEVGR
jgi:hypothetical protein